MRWYRFFWVVILLGGFWQQLRGQCSVSLGPDTSICAATFSIVPSLTISTFEDSLEIVYDATQGQSGLVGANKVYMHSGAEMVPFGGWQNTVGNWGLDDGVGQMTNIGTDRWRIRILPHAYYNYPANVTPNGIFFVFRNADGSAVGKDNAGNDIWADMQQDPPVSTFGGIQFSWKRDGLAGLLWSDGSTGSSLAVSTAGTYWVTMTDTAGCSATDTLQLNLGSIPVVDLGQPAICDGNPVILDAGAGFTSYEWSTGATTQTISLGSAALVTVTVTNAAGCTGMDIVNVPAATAPTAFFTPSVFGFTVQVADGSTGGGNYQWDFDGNGTTDATTAGTTSHAYSTAGTYTITLIVQNFCGADTFSQAITIGGVGVENQYAGGYALFPNPASDRLTLELDLTKGGLLTLHLMDQHGRMLLSESSVQNPGFFRKELDIQSLPGGLYHLAVIRGREVFRRSFVKI